MGELPVFANRFPFFAVWNDVIDRAVFEGKNLIRAKCTDRSVLEKLLTELESEKSWFNRYIVKQRLNYRFKRRPT